MVKTAVHGCVLPKEHPAYPSDGAVVTHLGGKVWIESPREIDSDLAVDLLEHNPLNRNLSERTVKAYARDMAEGRWEQTGDAIRFADTGRLLDGQHRLWAVIESGAPLTVPIITGLPESSQDHMDIGRRRTAGDQLKLSGYSHYNAVASAARILWMWNHNALFSNVPSPSSPEILEHVHALAETGLTLDEAAAITNNLKKLMRSHSVLTACYHRAWNVDASATREFFSALETGADLVGDSPILALRNGLLRRLASPIRAGNGLATQAEYVYLLARAWTLWRAGQGTTKIVMPKGGLNMKTMADFR